MFIYNIVGSMTSPSHWREAATDLYARISKIVSSLIFGEGAKSKETGVVATASKEGTKKPGYVPPKDMSKASDEDVNVYLNYFDNIPK